MSDLRLGLIGDNIAQSKAPLLHRLAGRLTGLDVRYDLLVPADLDKGFDEVFDACARSVYRGVNVTYPYKERAAAKVRIDDPLVRAMGAVNTVVFTPEGPRGYNTDHSGFKAAYRAAACGMAPGPVCVIGAGGVGRAVTFGLAALGCRDLRLIDQDCEKAQRLADALRVGAPQQDVTVFSDAGEAVRGAEGLVNCTPVGMVGYEGTPLPAKAMAGARWAFDAVYTPVDTQFLRDAAASGLAIISGYELFLHQGLDAWGIFSGRPVEEAVLRAVLAQASDAEQTDR